MSTDWACRYLRQHAPLYTSFIASIQRAKLNPLVFIEDYLSLIFHSQQNSIGTLYKVYSGPLRILSLMIIIHSKNHKKYFQTEKRESSGIISISPHLNILIPVYRTMRILNLHVYKCC